ncbi:DNA-3-methyladenine glycosylase family protein [Subtercola sp. YIM 133946]|uniref:DNA-3-methyladenine glycosylase family protein n=1 Tax=Subtercola sp. YIM 133946 TaxID=3118909 RepID=UPI002F932885
MIASNRYTAATAALVARDPVIAALAAETGPITFDAPTESNYAALVRAITYQQLAGAAAHAIHGRLVALLDGDVVPERLAAFSPDELRAVGLSAAKAASMLDLTAKALDGSVPLDDDVLARLTDEEVVARRITVRGIGRWTSEVFLMIHLGRPDVLPGGDLGIRKGYGLAWRVPTPTEKQLLVLGEAYRPYRSVLSWYCWRAAELYGGSTASAVADSA